MQLTVFDTLPPRLDERFRSARHIDLGQGAWVEYVPEWISGQHRVLHLMGRATDWEHHQRTMYDRVVKVPRLLGRAPNDQLAAPVAQAISDSPALRVSMTRDSIRRSRADERERAQAESLLREAKTLLSARYRCDLSAVTLACYRHGQDSVAWHGDKLGAFRPNTVVAIASVGERRRFLLRPAGGKTTLSFCVGWGDLLVMGGSCQETWEHCVPKAKTQAPRIAIMFRQIVPRDDRSS